MTSQSPRIYTYKITFEEVPYYYYGVHKEKVFNEEYWGSPKTHKWCWDFYTPKKQILELFDYNDEGWVEARCIENRLIKSVFNTDKLCLNASCGGKLSIDSWNAIRKNHKEKLKSIKHQQGEKNSMYGTLLIHNLDLRQTKRIGRDEKIPSGWNKGAIYNFDSYFKKQQRRKENKVKVKQKRDFIKKQNIKYYSHLYEIYKDTNFSHFCEVTGYSKTQQNLCSNFKKYVKNYSPKAKNGR
jgi:hypothetical protein